MKSQTRLRTLNLNLMYCVIVVNEGPGSEALYRHLRQPLIFVNNHSLLLATRKVDYGFSFFEENK